MLRSLHEACKLPEGSMATLGCFNFSSLLGNGFWEELSCIFSLFLGGAVTRIDYQRWGGTHDTQKSIVIFPAAIVTKRTAMGLVLGWKMDSRGSKLTVHGLILVSRHFDCCMSSWYFYMLIAYIYQWGYYILFKTWISSFFWKFEISGQTGLQLCLSVNA